MMEPEQPDRQRIRDAATALPFVAAALLMPPLIGIFVSSIAPGGIPLIVLYIFTVWAMVILGAFVLARRLGRPVSENRPEEPPDGGGAG
jgi:hypothetical protein